MEEPAWFKGLVALLTPARKAVRLQATPPLPRQVSDGSERSLTAVPIEDVNERDVLDRTAKALGCELCNMVLDILALIMWQGLSGCDSWKVCFVIFENESEVVVSGTE